MLQPHPRSRRVRRRPATVLATVLAVVALGCTAPTEAPPPSPTPNPAATTTTASPAPVPTAEAVIWHRGVAYGPDPAQVMDIAVPTPDVASPTGDREARPAMLLVHGGGWTSGSRHYHEATAAGLAAIGWVAATIDYRLAPDHVHPAAADDVRAALAHLHDRVGELAVDPERVVLAGDSAGGHLASLVALQGARPPVAAWISWSGVHALEQLPDRLAGTRRAWLLEHLAAVLGCDPAASACTATARDASPVTHATGDDPPGLLVHSTDELVPLDDAAQLQAALEEAGASVRLVTRDGQAHGGDLIVPTAEETAAFLDEVLGLRAAA